MKLVFALFIIALLSHGTPAAASPARYVGRKAADSTTNSTIEASSAPVGKQSPSASVLEPAALNGGAPNTKSGLPLTAEVPWLEIKVDLAGSGIMKHIFDPEEDKDLLSEFTNRTGLNPSTDLAAMAGRVEFKNPLPGFLIVISGRFDPVRISSELTKEFPDFQPQKGPDGISGSTGPFTFLIAPDLFLARNSGPGSEGQTPPLVMARELMAGLPNKGISAKLFPSGRFNDPESLPEPVRESPIFEVLHPVIKDLESLTFTAADDMAKLDLATSAPEKAVSDLAGALNGYIGLGSLLLNTQEAAVKQKMSQGSAFRLLSPDVLGARASIRRARNLLTRIKVETRLNSLLVTLRTEDLAGSVGTFLPIVAVTGVVAAIAIPNFVKAKKAARHRSCMASLRVLSGALEMYAMDNDSPMNPDTPMARVQNKLVTDEYIKAPVNCMEGGEYELFSGPEGVEVRCSVHGGIGEPETR